MKPKIKNLEKKFYSRDGCKIIIPIPPKTAMYGCPLFSIEWEHGRKQKDRCYYIEILYLKFPHFKKQGYSEWRKIACNLYGFDLSQHSS